MTHKPLPEKRHEERIARYEGRHVIIEKVYRGRGNNVGLEMAKIHDSDGTVRNVPLTQVELL